MQSNYIKIFQKHKTAALISALAVFIIAFSILFAVLITDIYESHAAGNTQDELRYASQYFTDIIRRCEDTSQIRTASLGGSVPALVLPQNAQDENGREIWLFTYEGNLRKSVSAHGDTVSPESGKAVMAMESTDFSILSSGLVSITFHTENNDTMTINVYCAGSGGSGENE